jgi:hypothetical protein
MRQTPRLPTVRDGHSLVSRLPLLPESALLPDLPAVALLLLLLLLQPRLLLPLPLPLCFCVRKLWLTFLLHSDWSLTVLTHAIGGNNNDCRDTETLACTCMCRCSAAVRIGRGGQPGWAHGHRQQSVGQREQLDWIW